MAILKTAKPAGSMSKIVAIAVISVIVVFALSFGLSRNGIPLSRMIIFIGFCTFPAVAFVIFRINKNRIVIFDDHFESVQGMSSVSVIYSEVKSVSVMKRPLMGGFGPTAVSVPMMVFTTGSGERELIFSEYRPADISIMINALISRNPDYELSGEVKAFIDGKMDAGSLKPTFNYAVSIIAVAAVIIYYLIRTGKVSIHFPW